MTFKQWIKTRRTTDNPRGDFIADAKVDRKMPENFEAWEDLERYLHRIGAWSEAIKSGHMVWREYAKTWRR